MKYLRRRRFRGHEGSWSDIDGEHGDIYYYSVVYRRFCFWILASFLTAVCGGTGGGQQASTEDVLEADCGRHELINNG